MKQKVFHIKPFVVGRAPRAFSSANRGYAVNLLSKKGLALIGPETASKLAR